MRRLTYFDTANGRWNIPYADAATEHSHSYRSRVIQPHNMQGAYDTYGGVMPPRAAWSWRHSAKIVGCEDDLNRRYAKMLRVLDGGRGRLWKADHNLGSNRRWTPAKAQNLLLPWRPSFVNQAEIEVEFFGEDPHWYENLRVGDHASMETISSSLMPIQGEDIEEYLFAKEVITTTPHSFTVVNNGDAICRRVLFRLQSDEASGLFTPTIFNVTPDLPEELDDIWVKWGGTADDADTYVQINTWLPQCNKSLDNGATWANDYPNLTHSRHYFFGLVPGENEITVTNVLGGNFTLYMLWYHTYNN